MVTKKPVTRVKKYPQRKVPGTDKSIDRARPAKPVGWRISEKTGRRYFEDRENRSDTEKERKYHGGAGRRATPGKKTGKQSTRVPRSLSTTRRVSPINKHDVQKKRTLTVKVRLPRQLKPKKSGEEWYRLPIIPITEEELKKQICKVERSIHELNVENIYVFDRKRGLLYSNVGTETQVTMPSHLRGGEKYIVTHNHPEKHGIPNTLSGADIGSMMEQKHYEVRACCYGYVYSVKPGDCMWSGGELEREWDKRVKATVNRVRGQLLYDDNLSEKENELREYTKLWSALDRAFGRFCKEAGLEYKKVKICST